MHRMICHDYCRLVSVNLGSPKSIGDCASDKNVANQLVDVLTSA